MVKNNDVIFSNLFLSSDCLDLCKLSLHCVSIELWTQEDGIWLYAALTSLYYLICRHTHSDIHFLKANVFMWPFSSYYCIQTELKLSKEYSNSLICCSVEQTITNRAIPWQTIAKHGRRIVLLMWSWPVFSKHCTCK